MKVIFAHRALFNSKENTLAGIRHYIDIGLGLELDLRFNKNGVYLSHDPSETGESFERSCPYLAKSKSFIALHVKELHAIPNIVKLVKKFSLKNFFLFNQNYELMVQQAEDCEVGYYSSKIPSYNIKAKILWCDEVEEQWYSTKIINELHKENKILFAVSKELVTKCSSTEMIHEWKRLIQMGFDGICTNYPEKLEKFWN